MEAFVVSPRRSQACGLLCALLGGLVACSGEIGSSGSNPDPGVGGAGPPSPGAVDPGTKGIHRLNSAEYNNTVGDVLGTRLQPANASWLTGEIGGFDNIAAVLDVDEEQYGRYFDSAGAIADDVFAAPDLKSRVMVCATEDTGCVQSIIRTTGRRLFRRPLDNDEVGTYQKVYTAAKKLGETHEGSVKQVLRALLSSGEFIFRIENDARPNTLDRHPLGAFELAARLSYFLWSSAPDDALLDAAADNSLLTDAKLIASVDRMMGDPVKSTRLVENFVGQWLGARKLPEHSANPMIFSDWSPALATTLTKEMYLYFGDFLKNDRTWMDFMKADVNFVDDAVAKLYGITAGTPGATTPQRVEVTTDQRFGFAGLGGFLALSSLADRTSPTTRGRWILGNLMCQEPPAPPKGVPDLGGVTGLDLTKSIRVALEEHRKNASCAACHSIFDGFGLALENFDAIGRFRTAYPDGSSIDARAEVSGASFEGLSGLADYVSQDPRFSTCVTQTMFKYSLGRLVTAEDAPALDKIKERWLQGTPSLRRLVQSLVLADTFRSRHGAN